MCQTVVLLSRNSRFSFKKGFAAVGRASAGSGCGVCERGIIAKRLLLREMTLIIGPGIVFINRREKTTTNSKKKGSFLVLRLQSSLLLIIDIALDLF